jgi:hypothetical protein
MESKNHLLITISLSSILLLLLVSVIGCTNNTKYKEVTINREGIRCSFSYPSSYSEYRHSFHDENAVIIVERFPTENSPGKPDREIAIIVTPTDDDETVVDSTDNSSLQGFAALYKEFNVIDHYYSNISSVKCEVLVYSGFYLHDIYFDTHHIKCWEINLNYRGLLWKIRLISNADREDGAQEEFQQLLKTFKFLD